MFSMLHEGKSRDLMLLLVLVPCFLSQAWCESLRQRRTWPTRVYPGHVGFPDNETWVYFAQKLDGYVITPQNCTAYENATKAHNLRTIRRPALIVRAQSIQDVQRVILLSRRYNLHLTVRSSGHDFIGRNSHDGSINLDMSELKEVTVNLKSRRNKAGEVTAQSGASWADVYKEVDKALGPDENGNITGRVVVGGSCTTVAMGGYGQGGGHSPIGRKHGVAVDNLLDIIIVTVDGRIRNVNATHVVTYEFDGSTSVSNDTELFWALRGGGGGTWGVVFSYTYKLHHAPQRIRRLIMIIQTQDSLGNDINKEIVKFALKQVNQLSSEWGGYISLSAGSISNLANYSSLLMVMNHAGSYSSTSNNQLNDLRNRSSVKVIVDTCHPTYLDFALTALNVPFINSYTFGSFTQSESLADPAKLEDYVDLLYEMRRNGIFISSSMIGGNMVNVEEGSTPVNPGFRHGILCLLCFQGFRVNGDTYDPQKVESTLAYAQRLDTFSLGTYFNEAVEDTGDWKTRLLRVKKRVDPTNYLWCHNCVGSDLGKNYRKPRPGSFPGEPAYSYFNSSAEYDQVESTYGQHIRRSSFTG